MGSWGTGLFADDVACDIRSRFQALLAEGKTVPQATRVILVEWQEAVEDADDGPIIVLALASLQWDQGALQPAIKKRALSAIEDGANLDRWRATGDPKTVKARRQVLDRLRSKLMSPPRQKSVARGKTRAKKSAARRRPPPEPIVWSLGGIVAYRLRSGDWILFHVVAREDYSKTETLPTFALLDWRGTSLPAPEGIPDLPYLAPPETVEVSIGNQKETSQADLKERRAYCIQVATRSERGIPRSRIRLLDATRKIPRNMPRGWIPGTLWRGLDHQLEVDLGLK